MMDRMKSIMERIRKANLPIEKVKEIREEDIGPWFSSKDIFLCSLDGPYIRVYWTRKPTKDEILKLRKMI